jgi:hypothetical protein
MRLIELGIICVTFVAIVITASMLGNATHNTNVADQVSCEVLSLAEEGTNSKQPRNCEAKGIGARILEILYEDSEPEVKLQGTTDLGERVVSISGINSEQCLSISAKLFRHVSSIESSGYIKSPNQEHLDPQQLATGCGRGTDETINSLRVVLKDRDDERREIGSVMSPCQCKMATGCGIMWSVPDGALYADGTSPEDYDEWDQYHGKKNVPAECRPSQIKHVSSVGNSTNNK